MDWHAYAQLLEDWQVYKARLRKLADEGLVPRDATELVLELTRPRISLTEIALRQIAEKLRQEAIESLERHGGTPRTVEVRDAARGRTRTATHIRLSRPVKAYVAYDGKHIHLVRNVDEDARGRELERRVLRAVGRGEAEVYPADMDGRLLYEVELPSEAAKLLGADKAPLPLMLNLGWLLSDDAREVLKHTTARLGQVVARIMHWLALAEWARTRRIADANPAAFKLSVGHVTQAQKGTRPVIMIRPIGRVARAIKAAYDRFGLQIGEPERVRQRGYAVLKALRESAFERRGRAYAVRHVGAWLAFAAALKTLVLGDGNASLTMVKVATGDVSGLADALGGHRARDEVVVKPAILRILPPLLPTLFEKDVALYRGLALHIRGLEVAIGGRKWLLHASEGYFKTEGSKAAGLAEVLRGVLGEVAYASGRLRLSEGRAMKLVELGFARLLSEPEYEAARLAYNARRVAGELGLSQAEIEALEEAVRLARRVGFGETLYAKRKGGREYRYTLQYAYLYYDSEEKMQKALEALQRIGYKPAAHKDKKRIMVQRREYVEALKKITQKQDNQSLFPHNKNNHRYKMVKRAAGMGYQPGALTRLSYGPSYAI